MRMRADHDDCVRIVCLCVWARVWLVRFHGRLEQKLDSITNALLLHIGTVRTRNTCVCGCRFMCETENLVCFAALFCVGTSAVLWILFDF